MPRERKSLIERGSILAGPDLLGGPDTLSRVIQRDREQSGRPAPENPAAETGRIETGRIDIGPAETKAEDDGALRGSDAPSDGQNVNHITGNMIGNMVSHTPDRPDIRQVRRAYGQPGGQAGSQPQGQSERRTDAQAAGQGAGPPGLLSAARSIQSAVANPAVRVRYNAVTFKIHPATEDWVNEHVRATGRMKQDVLNDALTLYRNLVEEGIPGDGGGQQ